MASVHRVNPPARACAMPLKVEAEHCSVCGRRPPNEDYVLFERNIGMCIADGIGGAPLGDAVARYACHIAMESLRNGSSPYEAVKQAGECVRRFVTIVDSPGSGASIVVARLNGNILEASWAGDSAIFVPTHKADGPSITSSLERNQPSSSMPLCGKTQPEPGSLFELLAKGDTVVMCTDGVWKSAGPETIARLMLEDGTPREIAARLVLGHQPEDDSTVLVARMQLASQTRGSTERVIGHGAGHRNR